MTNADLSKLGFTLQNSSPNLYLITPEQATIIGNELVHQYRTRQPKFLALHTTEGCETEHEELSKAIDNEPVLLFYIYMAANRAKKGSTRDVEKTCRLLQSKNLEDQRLGMNSFSDLPFYRSAMMPYASNIGKLLLAIHRQRLAYQEFVVREPVVKTKLPVEHHIPRTLLDAVPALKSVAPFIQLRDTIQAFCKDNVDTLKGIRGLLKVGVDFQAFLDLPTDMRSGIILLKITDRFTSQLQEIFENIGGKEIALNQFVTCLEAANSLLDAYAELKKAHDLKMQAASAYQTAHQKVMSHTSATETTLADVTALAEATKNALGTKADLQTKISSFQDIVSEHFQCFARRA